jgi:hypothetical protein
MPIHVLEQGAEAPCEYDPVAYVTNTSQPFVIHPVCVLLPVKPAQLLFIHDAVLFGGR